jgi:putative Mg2+ transporter-C (MgtC) family protein
LEWSEIALRLALTVAGGTLIGVNRSEHGRAAGLRTTLLVALAAAVSMIQVNLLLATRGKSPDSYIVMDLMRLPLGILSGMGFIGGGVILRRDNMVLGVTTAATLWFVTVMGLCFGGGQLGLGATTCVMGFLVLQGLKPIEDSWKQDRHATLIVATTNGGPTEQEIKQTIQAAGYKIVSASLNVDSIADQREIKCQVQWRDRPNQCHSPPFVADLAGRSGTLKVVWQG